ncbi:MAG: HAD family phosphatase [bacterium]
MIKALIFDFDGVIANTEPLHARAVASVFKRMNLPVTHQDIQNAIGTPDPGFFKNMLVKYNGSVSDEIVHNMLIQKRKIYMDIAASRVKPLPGIVKLLESTASYPKAIATTCSQETVRPLLKKMGILPHFRIIIGYYDVENCKPHPEPYLKAAQGLGIPPHRCMVFEDSPTGALSALGAGCRVTGVLTNFGREHLKKCHFIIDNFKSTEKVIDLFLKCGALEKC